MDILNKIGEFVSNFKLDIKKYILCGKWTNNTRRADIFDILCDMNNEYELNAEELERKIFVITYFNRFYKSKMGVRILGNYLRELKCERNCSFHKNIVVDNELNQLVLDYCNEIWEYDDMNEPFVNMMFQVGAHPFEMFDAL